MEIIMNLYYCTKHGPYDPASHNSGCHFCAMEDVKQMIPLNYTATFQQEKKMTRKYLPTLSELIDRLTITQLKEVKIPEHKEQYAQEIADMVHDIQLLLNQEFDSGGTVVTAKMIRDIIVLAQMNTHIWVNETNFRKGKREGNDLELTHGLNGIRNTAKNKIQENFGGRKDYKVDNVEAFKDWVPSDYDGDKK